MNLFSTHCGLRLSLNKEVEVIVVGRLIDLRSYLIENVIIQSFDRCALVPFVLRRYVILGIGLVFSKRIHELKELIEYFIILQELFHDPLLFKVL